MVVSKALLDLSPLRTSLAFRRLWIGRTISVFGSQMTVVAVVFQVWQLTHSTIWTGGVGMAQALPLIALGLVGGSLVDRRDRRSVYLLATTGGAGCSALLALQAFGGGGSVSVVLGVVAAQAAFGAVSAPAARTFVPRLLPADQVAAGMALNRISMQAMLLVGPALGGVAIGALGLCGCYLLDAVSFAAALVGAFSLPPMQPQGGAARPGVHGILEGLAFVVHASALRGALVTDLATTVLSFPISLFPLLNAERFHGSPRTLGLFLAAIGLGGIVASVLSGLYMRTLSPGVAMLLGSASWGAALSLVALVPNAGADLALLVVAGIADTVAVVSRNTIVQLQTPDGLRGRVSAAELIVGQAGPNLGNMRAGVVADATSGTIALLSGGLLCLAAVTLVGAKDSATRGTARPATAHADASS
jgi:MFS family permease